MGGTKEENCELGGGGKMVPLKGRREVMGLGREGEKGRLHVSEGKAGIPGESLESRPALRLNRGRIE